MATIDIDEKDYGDGAIAHIAFVRDDQGRQHKVGGYKTEATAVRAAETFINNGFMHYRDPVAMIEYEVQMIMGSLSKAVELAIEINREDVRDILDAARTVVGVVARGV